jgi:uncharacterized protein YegJ (DUF2314 family)
MKGHAKAAPKEDDFVSIVMLLPRPQALTGERLGAAVQRAHGPSAGENDQILQPIKEGHAFLLKLGRHILTVNNSFNPYFDDPAAAAASVPELRRRKAFAEHRAWRSVDYIAGSFQSDAEKAYGILGKLSAELLDDGYLGLYFPQTNEIVPASSALVDKLRAFYSLEDLHETFDAVVPVEEDDPRLMEVVAEARARWPEFLEAFSRRRANELFVVKSCFADENGKEWMWSTVERIEADKLIGRLSNRPNSVKHVCEGEEIVVQAEGIGDWFYANEAEQVGQFSVRLLEP